ncbi:phage minor tail protein G [Salmonella enterica]|uniref:phage tail assembly chaperone G n=1 Tax=Salmonella enterica TaxID=28901 RepID=UPI0012803044|nr:phage minor tail protein G [Salmonella enterica]EBQ9004588.1 phage minor tail protein G [Salmonella enterica subsp. enterica serovar Blockley]EBR0040749.1 phage minor tail protein G [Salmonella enterica subsp. enterica serovar Oranienburg]ECD6162093.1 phage minor tail protein G [Salmonella enterica subsp. enterica]ECU7994673.1 phage minor tail protein G [Salmonella enterica subsp. enterica serovar Toucra]
MFLKKEPFEYNGETVTLSELSALQRMNHLAYLKKKEEEGTDDGQQVIEEIVRTGAMLVAMSLWHSHTVKGSLSDMDEETKKIEEEVITSWPIEAISIAQKKVLQLSGMINTDSGNDGGKEGESDGEVLSAGKSSKAS